MRLSLLAAVLLLLAPGLSAEPGCGALGCATNVTCTYEHHGACPDGYILMPCRGDDAVCNHSAYTCFRTVPTCGAASRVCGVPAGGGHAASQVCCTSADGKTCDAPPPPRNISLHRQLFVDDEIVDSLTAVLPVLNQPTKFAGPPMISYPRAAPGSDMLGIFEGTVHYDEQRNLFQLWYMPCVQSWQHCWLAYATSTDGHHWERPDLGIIEYNGTTANNFVFDSGGVGEIMPAIVVDPPERTGPNNSRKYKLMHRITNASGMDGSCLGIVPLLPVLRWTYRSPS
jgi:hypothetical protein